MDVPKLKNTEHPTSYIIAKFLCVYLYYY